MTKQTKKLTSLVITSLNVIEKSCKTMAKSFGTDYIPMNLYLSALEKAKWEVSKDNQAAATYAEQYNLMLDSLGKEASKDMHTSIGLDAISYMNREVKKAFKNGITKKQVWKDAAKFERENIS